MMNPSLEEVVSQARKLLGDSPFAELHGVDVESRDERVHLRGEVQTYFLKQVAQETVRSATHGHEVKNDLRVELRRRIH